MHSAVIVDVVRTPVGCGRAEGALASVRPTDLLATTLQALVQRTAASRSSAKTRSCFAPVVLAWQRETGVDLSPINPYGSAIAVGQANATIIERL